MPTEEATGRINYYDDITPLENTRNIVDLLTAVRKKTKGADVREAIARLIEVISENASRDGNANLEVSLARGIFDTLKDRLDDQDINYQTNKSSIDLLAKQMISFTQLKNGSTTGDAELINARLGYNGMNYDTLGESLREQFSDIFSSLESAVQAGVAGYSYSNEKVTNLDTSTKTISINGPTQAYESGNVFLEDILVTGIILDNRVTTTTFSIFVLDSSNKVIDSILNLTPTITNGSFELPRNLNLIKGSKLTVRFLNGTFYYSKASTNDYVEYRQGDNTSLASPIAAAYNIKYKTSSISFLNGSSSLTDTVSLSDYILPKFEEVSGQYYLQGRWFKKSDGTSMFDATNNQGSLIYSKVNGASTLTVGLKPFTEPNNPYYYAYSIDGGPFIRKQLSDNVVNLPNANEHIVQIVMDGIGENDPVGGGKWTGQLGIYLTGLTVDAGTIKAIKPLNRKAIFIGDSITEGINVLTTGAIGASNSASNNYAFQASKNLNTVPYMIGYGGTGVTNNASFHKAIDAVNYFYNGVQSDTPKIDYIVMAHGFNDNTLINNGTVTVDQFKAAYNEVLDRLAIKYSGSPIFCVVPFGAQALKPHIESCIASRPYCYLVSSAGWNISTTDGVHPDSAGSKVLGKNIATEIEKILTKQYFMN